MSAERTTITGWGERLGGSIRGVLVGLVLFALGFPVLYLNEGRSVKTAKAIDEGEESCISLDSNAEIDPEMNGKLVHLTGKAETDDVLSDDVFGVSVNAIALERNVEMYQWIEEIKTTEKKKLGGKVEKVEVPTYRKGWSSTAVDSSSFMEAGHDNPCSMEFQEDKTFASNVRFGAFHLGERQIERIGAAQAYRFPASFTSKVERVQVQGTVMYVPNAETRLNEKNNRIVASQPRIGDMRVTYKVVLPHEISIVAKQHGDTFVDYTTTNGRKLSYLVDGISDAEAMFSSARASNSFMTWLLRIVGFIMMYLGLSMVLKPLSVLADVLPILGDIVGVGAGIVAFLVALPCALVTVAVAWVLYRPVLAVVLFALAALCMLALYRRRGARKAVQGSPTRAV